MTSFVYLRNLATSDIPISGFPGCLCMLSGFAGAAACFVSIGFCSCLQRVLAVALLLLAVMFTGIGHGGGFNANHVDFAPK